MTKVLAAIDNSPVARLVLSTALMVAELFGASPEALNVREDHAGSARESAKAAGVSFREVTGDVVDRISEAAAVPDVAALVIGVRGGARGPQPTGHIALALLTRITTPLVVVPPGARPSAVLRRLVVPLDGTPATAALVQPVMSLAASAGIEIVVMHVCDKDCMPMFTEQPQHEARAFAEEFIARYAPATPVVLEQRVGVPADEVLTAAVELDADLLVIGWAQEFEPGRAQVVKQLLAESPMPLLLLPSGDKRASSAESQ